MSDRLPTADDIEEAAASFPRDLVRETPLFKHERFSEMFDAEILFKDETKQRNRSYKNRGAYNAISKLPDDGKEIVCVSAGNHAQGVALSCNFLKRKGRIFMPITTPPQKIAATRRHGNGFVEVILIGDTYDQADAAARSYMQEHDAHFIHPFNDPDVIAGQGTVALEILNTRKDIDYIVAPIGGGGLIAGISQYARERAPHVQVIGVEQEECAAMYASREAGCVTTLEQISSFIEATAVRTPGNISFELVQQNVRDLRRVPQNRVCSTLLDMYEIDGINVELAGALAPDALTDMCDIIKGKTVACILSGGNLDPRKFRHITGRAELYRGLRSYLRVILPERAKSLRDVQEIFPDNVSISYIHYDEQDDESGLNGEQQAHVLLGLKNANGGPLPDVKAMLSDKGYPFSDVTNDRMLHDMIGR